MLQTILNSYVYVIYYSNVFVAKIILLLHRVYVFLLIIVTSNVVSMPYRKHKLLICIHNILYIAVVFSDYQLCLKL